MTAHRFQELTRAEALDLLGSVGVGRIVFTHQALPAIRPVSHLLDDGQVIVRGNAGAGLSSVLDTVVAYEADLISPSGGISWSVVVTGMARRLRGGAALARYEELLRPWTAGQSGEDYVVRIHPELVTGYSIVDENSARGAASG
ncbi:pyridoxamine 5'-phosphate oxidase family protein [Amycolatopsis sp.]|uniref:pyridoxamine 5'-phosphate oxidase family protein n=1 Tax=Amycolatopsis sp. TaxID=37632 RepID=UPI002CA2BDA8|nr:pyridoxamine 5'-phosphate oxidase family protein [Amycolatopsis sp.]HVV14754.1 pyridoxamine 5'-phosphate oxidase family protein [Amycolatopsis sp.]